MANRGPAGRPSPEEGGNRRFLAPAAAPQGGGTGERPKLCSGLERQIGMVSIGSAGSIGPTKKKSPASTSPVSEAATAPRVKVT